MNGDKRHPLTTKQMAVKVHNDINKDTKKWTTDDMCEFAEFIYRYYTSWVDGNGFVYSKEELLQLFILHKSKS